ncbi:MAG TPA: heparinase II/III family protein [Gaiellaceae bacterium]|nr:heparinase II/III family protein [Gaiellaceae bacterium]
MGSLIAEGTAPPVPERSGRRRWLIYGAICLFTFLFAAKVLAYVVPHAVRPIAAERLVARIEGDVRSRLDNAPFLHSCPEPDRLASIPGGWVCVSTNAPQAAYGGIFASYPATIGSREYVYKSTTAGTLAAGRALIRNVYDVPRYAPYRANGLPTWNEDPHRSVYWRFNFYALRPTQNLLAAYLRTRDPRYAQKLLAIDESFFAGERSSRFAWSDDHAVAFRSMVLVNQWWQLRYHHQLTEAQSSQFLRELERTGQFLADVNHYQPEHNHGTNEAAALLELGVDFPTLPHARAWLTVARERLAYGIDSLVDGDGALIENSPYYDFYTLDKYWQIRRFAQHAHISIAADFESRIRKMIEYATYILQPDSSVPLLGASLQDVVHDAGSFKQMAKIDASFRYVLTHGDKGRRPKQTSIFFPSTGQTIFRSGWGKGNSFVEQSFATFNVGPYRTPHSNLDALAITLYGGGIPLLPGAGLYTYSTGAMRDYFHGTASHDTVVVDDRDQSQGAAVAGKFGQEAGVTYQTGESSLYHGVTHRRLVMMIDKTHFLVVDRLTSSNKHVYDQMFHLFPGAHVTRNGLTVSGRGATVAQTITIHQLDPRPTQVSLATGVRNPAAGLCSEYYQHLIPCTSVKYEQAYTKDATFVTLLTIGPADPSFHIAYRGAGMLSIQTGTRTLRVGLSASATVDEVATATDPTPPKASLTALPGTEPANWYATRSGQLTRATGDETVNPNVVQLTTSGGGQATLSDDAVAADLQGRNLVVELKVDAVQNLGALDVQLSNDDWQITNSIDVRDAYPARYDGEWMRLSLGRGGVATQDPDAWATRGTGRFDWSNIDGVRLAVEPRSAADPPVTVSLRAVESTPTQSHAAVVFIFDDGYNSILPAAAYLHDNGMPGDVAAIGKYVELPAQDHLNVDDLRRLQNNWGWNIVNHTQSHVDALLTYRHPLRLGAYEQDILQGAQFLERAGLNSAPNWFVYPHGTTDAALDTVVRRFYKFARTTDGGPEAFPFGEPLRVKTLEIQDPADSEGGAAGVFTSPGQVQRAVLNAKRYHLTLILTFHRIHSEPADPPGYPLASFEKIVGGIRSAGVKVTTLSGLDAMMGVPEDNRIDIKPGKPSQIVVSIKARLPHRGLLSRLWHAV